MNILCKPNVISKFDLKRKIIFPSKLTTPLAEDIGIMIGDGHIGLYRRQNKIDYVIQCSGNLITDWKYYFDFVQKLKKQLFNLDFSIKKTQKNTLKFKINSKGLLNFYTAIIKLPLGKKTNIKIPSSITQKKDLMFSCIRGIIDTDGCLVFRKKGKDFAYYPSIKLACSSLNLIEQISEYLLKEGYKVTKSINLNNKHSKTGKISLRHEFQVNGKKQLDKWMKEIGFSNPKNLLKYNFWKKNGFCPSDEIIRKMMTGPEGFDPPTTLPSTAIH